MFLVIILMGSVIIFATYIHKKDFGTVQLEFEKTGTLTIEGDFTVFGTIYGKIVNMEVSSTGKALVTVKLKYPLTVYQGYHAYVYDVGLFGKRAICLENGPRSNKKVSLKHPIKGTYYPGIADILGSMYKMKLAFQKLQVLTQKAYGNSPEGAKLVIAFNKIKKQTDNTTNLINTLLKELDLGMAKGLPQLEEILAQGNRTLINTSKVAGKLDKANNTLMPKAFSLLDKAKEVDKALTNLAHSVDSNVSNIDSIKLLEIEKKLADIETQIHITGSNAHKLQLHIKRYNSSN